MANNSSKSEGFSLIFLMSCMFYSDLGFFPSINFTANIEISYSNNIGIPSPIWEIGSGGVKIAATAKTPTITYFLFFLNPSELTKPTLANNVKRTGS